MLDGKEYSHYLYWRWSFSAKCLYIGCSYLIPLFYTLKWGKRSVLPMCGSKLPGQPNTFGGLPVSKLIVITNNATNNSVIFIIFIAWKVFRYGVFYGPYFPAFGLNTERSEVSLHIQPECGKIQTRKNSVFGHISHSESFVNND